MSITKAQILDHFGSPSKAAEFFGISTQAVWQWEDGPIPELRAAQAMLRLPHVFSMPAQSDVQEQARAAA